MSRLNSSSARLYVSLQSKWGNFCFTVSLLATPLTITALYTVGFYNGGPVAIIYGWLLVSFFTMFVVFSMAEILSSLPVSYCTRTL